MQPKIKKASTHRILSVLLCLYCRSYYLNLLAEIKRVRDSDTHTRDDNRMRIVKD